jgi:hypothetical protein
LARYLGERCSDIAERRFMPVHLAEIKETDRGLGGDVGKQCRGAGGSGGFGSRHFPRGFLSRGGGAVMIAAKGRQVGGFLELRRL